MTLFLDRARGERGPLLEQLSAYNMNVINIPKFGEVPYGTFHSKLTIYEFNDRLRVVVSSANLGIKDWSEIS